MKQLMMHREFYFVVYIAYQSKKGCINKDKLTD